MNPKILLFAILGSFLVQRASNAQDAAPTSLSGRSAIAVIASGSGVFANVGGYRITFASSEPTYAVTSLSSSVGASAGTYTYSKTGANTGSLTVTDTAVGAAVAHTLVFSSASSGTYSISGSAGSQTGTIVLEGQGTAPTSLSAGTMQ